MTQQDPFSPRPIDLPTAVPLDPAADLSVLDEAKILAAPDSPADRDAWRLQLHRWRREARLRVGYDDSRYADSSTAWASRARNVAMVRLWDEALYDWDAADVDVDRLVAAYSPFGLGEADLAADLRISDESAFAWVRTRLVVAARAAGSPAPMMSVYSDIRDLAGLASSCAAGRALGMRGRAAIHPSQLPVIAAAFAPTSHELDWAREVLAALATAHGGVAVRSNGAMVDAAMARRARDLLTVSPNVSSDSSAI